ncbi:lasso peptide biosynthesis B2 protein [Halomonas sp. NO4]|uniref:lasso peptide biosynthesis B2 protein n=1 Tax=Halomonas sp. NO4 TaxID=2484813 RepID=UPI0023E43BC4|nr:lasso peptide biosynthesis B2 protein [Halomonas sp. NO4]
MEGAAALGMAWLQVRCLPFRWWFGWLGLRASGEVNAMDSEWDRCVGDVARTLHAINRRFGGRFTCLMLAMAAHWMLGRRGIGSSLVLGTRVESSSGGKRLLEAHAWVRVGDRVVLGEHGGRYTAVSSFVRQGSKRRRVVKAA